MIIKIYINNKKMTFKELIVNGIQNIVIFNIKEKQKNMY